MFRRAFRLAGILAAAVVTVMALISPASAVSDDFTDPDDTDGAIDIDAVSHDDDAETITYTLTTYDEWDPADTAGYEIRWSLDFDGDDSTFEACVVVSGSPLEAVVTDCDAEEFGDATPTQATDGTLTVEFDLALISGEDFFDEAGYGYRISAQDATADTEPDDVAPDEDAEALYRHDLGEATTTTTTTTVGSTTTSSVAVTTTTTLGSNLAVAGTAAPATPISAQPTYTG